jgi:hypothetical protein
LSVTPKKKVKLDFQVRNLNSKLAIRRQAWYIGTVLKKIYYYVSKIVHHIIYEWDISLAGVIEGAYAGWLGLGLR